MWIGFEDPTVAMLDFAWREATGAPAAAYAVDKKPHPIKQESPMLTDASSSTEAAIPFQSHHAAPTSSNSVVQSLPFGKDTSLSSPGVYPNARASASFASSLHMNNTMSSIQTANSQLNRPDPRALNAFAYSTPLVASTPGVDDLSTVLKNRVASIQESLRKTGAGSSVLPLYQAATLPAPATSHAPAPVTETCVLDEEFISFVEAPSIAPSAAVTTQLGTTQLGKRAHPGDCPTVLNEPNEVEHKRLERMKRNRASAQASRERRQTYANGLAKRITELETSNSELMETCEEIRRSNEELRKEIAQLEDSGVPRPKVSSDATQPTTINEETSTLLQQ